MDIKEMFELNFCLKTKCNSSLTYYNEMTQRKRKRTSFYMTYFAQTPKNN